MPNYWEIKAVRDQRAAAHASAVALLKSPTITAETRSAFNRAMEDVNRLGIQLAGLEGRSGSNYVQDRIDCKKEELFTRFVRYGVRSLDVAEQRSMEFRDVVEGAPMLTHVGTYSGLGFLVPTGFRDSIEQATKYFCPLSDPAVSGCQVIETTSGQPLPMPVSNDTNQQATIVGESQPVSEQDITTNHVVFGAYKLTSGVIKASIELLQDSGIDIDSWLAQRFGERYGRGLESYLTTGNGSNQPTGLLTAIEASGVQQIVSIGSSTNDGVGAANNTIGSQDLVNLEHGVDPSYRRGARYMLHDLTLASLQKLLDKYGRPLWTPGVANNAPDMINGYPYVINQSMTAIGSGVSGGDITMIFGDFSKFVIRKVKDLSVQRLEELYAVTGQVGFVSFARIDSNILDAGTHPLNILVQHS